MPNREISQTVKSNIGEHFNNHYHFLFCSYTNSAFNVLFARLRHSFGDVSFVDTYPPRTAWTDEIDGLMGKAHRLSTFSSLSVKIEHTKTDFTSFLWTIRNIRTSHYGAI